MFDLGPLFAALSTPLLYSTLVAFGYFILVAVMATTAAFCRGERSENAYRVLKVLTRRKPDPPGPADR